MNVWKFVGKNRRLNMMHQLDRLHSHKEKLCMLITSALHQDGGVIQEISGSVLYLVKLTDSRLVRRHQDHISC